MSTNELENKMLREINQIDEGLALKILKFFMRPAVKRAFSKLEKDPEVKAAAASHKDAAERLKKAMADLGDSADPRLKAIVDKLGI